LPSRATTPTDPRRWWWPSLYDPPGVGYTIPDPAGGEPMSAPAPAPARSAGSSVGVSNLPNVLPVRRTFPLPPGRARYADPCWPRSSPQPPAAPADPAFARPFLRPRTDDPAPSGPRPEPGPPCGGADLNGTSVAPLFPALDPRGPDSKKNPCNRGASVYILRPTAWLVPYPRLPLDFSSPSLTYDAPCPFS